jgi:hypothetical protein
MKYFEFEHISIKYFWGLFISSLFLMFFLIYPTVKITNYLAIEGKSEFLFGLPIFLGIPICLFFLKKHKIRRYGKAVLSPDKITLTMEGQSLEIDFNEIQSFKVDFYETNKLIKLEFENKDIFKLHGNPYFCEISAFKDLAENLEEALTEFSNKNSNNEVRREASIYERSWFILVLIVMTTICISLIFYGLYKGENIGIIVISLGFVVSMWVAYFQARMRINNRKRRIGKD